MYMEYYGLSGDPFRLAHDFRNLYSQPTFVKAGSYLQYGMQSGDGIVLISGKAGTGKTTVINSVLNEARQLSNQASVIECVDFDGAQLLSYYARLLGDDSPQQTLTDSIHWITGNLLKQSEQGRHPILVLDEAHHLTDDALTKLTLLANLQKHGAPLVQIFLVGQPAIWEKINQPQHEQLHQRLMATCEIAPLTVDETREYILQNLQAVGWNNKPAIASNVYTEVHRSSLGIRRWINLICSRLMLHAMAHDRQELELQDLCEVISDLISERLLPQEIRESNLLAA
ncbi:MAG: AAA family ATPase [Pseudomonadota bacterium]